MQSEEVKDNQETDLQVDILSEEVIETMVLEEKYTKLKTLGKSIFGETFLV